MVKECRFRVIDGPWYPDSCPVWDGVSQLKTAPPSFERGHFKKVMFAFTSGQLSSYQQQSVGYWLPSIPVQSNTWIRTDHHLHATTCAYTRRAIDSGLTCARTPGSRRTRSKS
ncbi:hypothetical protein E1B28_002318 [Marasmius oreades]|uniref:Uncharacterized protein n=1 Tax=Marasmius oreades TaxID=181124 RepID=A0A9P7UL76_9AGAR|nr:uncharacterized protein E1B28_002318 [Marasmius oreades]KAG7086358.1 hypothetical protein E1B28_002318 [Marasmius oreades]